MTPKRIKSPVMLAEMKPESLLDLINLFLEYCVFFRWIAFKNRPRGNLLLLRSLLVVGLFAGLYFRFFSSFRMVLQGIEIDSVVAMTAAVVVGFWYSSGVFHKKSSFCMNLYNDVMKEYAHGNREGGELLSVNLAANLLTLDLWSHRAFSLMFSSSLGDAIECRVADAADREKLVERANSGRLTIREARFLLGDHEHQLMQQISNPNRPSAAGPRSGVHARVA